MLQQLNIQNFQSHEDTAVRFADGVTVLVGSSDSGKSAVLRALNWLRTNRPRGSSFIRHGSGGTCRVELTTDADSILRHKDKNNNAYMLNGEELTALGSDVPELVVNALNLDVINVQGQFEPHFLVFDSPGKIARALNDVVHLDRAEATADRLAAGLRQFRSDAKTQSERADELDSQLKQYVGLDRIGEKLKKAESLRQRRDELARQHLRLTNLSDGLRKMKERLKSLPDSGKAEDLMGDVEILAREVDKGKSSLSRLLDFLSAVSKVSDKLEGVNVLCGLEPKAKKYEKEAAGIARKRQENERLESLCESLISLAGKLSKAELELDGEEKRERELLESLDICPTCGQELNGNAKERMLCDT